MQYNRQIKRRLLAIVRQYGTRYLSGRLVDIGCGLKPYEDVLKWVVEEHVGVDYAETPYDLRRVDIVATAYSIPVADATFDSAMATEVLEHLEEPVAALREWHRIVRPGGYLLLTVPFLWGVHDEPRDFFRYSEFGVSHVLHASGWEPVEVRHVGGFWSTFGQLLAYVFETYDRGPIRRTRVLPALGTLTQRLGELMESRSPRPAWGSHIVAVARRPE